MSRATLEKIFSLPIVQRFEPQLHELILNSVFEIVTDLEE